MGKDGGPVGGNVLKDESITTYPDFPANKEG